ncbi:dUTP diphosphatase [Treponema sp. R6D11]
MPNYATSGSAGMDLSTTESFSLYPRQRKLIPTGISVAIDEGKVGLVFIRSSLGYNKGLSLPNCVGVIDSDYRGEIFVACTNISNLPIYISKGERIAQLVVMPYSQEKIELEESLEETQRGAGGFGSTGSH